MQRFPRSGLAFVGNAARPSVRKLFPGGRRTAAPVAPWPHTPRTGCVHALLLRRRRPSRWRSAAATAFSIPRPVHPLPHRPRFLATFEPFARTPPTTCLPTLLWARSPLLFTPLGSRGARLTHHRGRRRRGRTRLRAHPAPPPRRWLPVLRPRIPSRLRPFPGSAARPDRWRRSSPARKSQALLVALLWSTFVPICCSPRVPPSGGDHPGDRLAPILLVGARALYSAATSTCPWLKSCTPPRPVAIASSHPHPRWRFFSRLVSPRRRHRPLAPSSLSALVLAPLSPAPVRHREPDFPRSLTAPAPARAGLHRRHVLVLPHVLALAIAIAIAAAFAAIAYGQRSLHRDSRGRVLILPPSLALLPPRPPYPLRPTPHPRRRGVPMPNPHGNGPAPSPNANQ